MTETEWLINKYAVMGSTGYLIGGGKMAAVWVLISVGYQILKSLMISVKENWFP